jgi:hypothetical protein
MSHTLTNVDHLEPKGITIEKLKTRCWQGGGFDP